MMDSKLFYKDIPPRYRLIFLAFFVLASIVSIMVCPPFALITVWGAAVIIYMTIKKPDNVLALQQDQKDIDDAKLFNKFIDVLYAGNFIDRKTTEDDLEIEVSAPLVYTLKVHQHGKTEKDLISCVEASLNAMACSSVEVRRSAPAEYVVVYTELPPVEILADMEIQYDELISEEKNLSISSLPVGRFVDGSPVCLNLLSRNALINGNPRSGKSVLLNALLCDLLRVQHPEKIIVMSPKILDFFWASLSCEMIQDPVEMLDELKKIREEAERRKEYCIARGLTKIDPEHFEDCPHITVIIDEFTVIKTTTAEDEKGKTVKIGEAIENAIMRLVAETGFAAISFVLCTQRVSSQNMRTDLRDLIAGCRCTMATETPESTKMILGDYAQYAPAHEIGADQKGVGYISLDGSIPRAFKGVLCTQEDQRSAASTKKKR